jgi:cob(I)alamin adenosyltransferase
MSLKDYKQKDAVVIVYTGEGKGKTSAALGLTIRGLGFKWRVAFIQFVKHWQTSEHDFLERIQPEFGDDLLFYKGGKGFFNAGELSAKDVSENEHKQAALETYKKALACVSSGKYDLVVCDEINNAVHDGLLTTKDLEMLIDRKAPDTSLCLTGRNFPETLLPKVDIATNMTKIKHHFDDKFLANKGIDY